MTSIGRGRLVIAVALLASCSGGSGGSTPQPTVTGNGFAPATGPGDTSTYFPQAVGNQWRLTYTSSETGRADIEGVLTATVAAPRTVLGVSATVISQVDSAGGIGSIDEYFFASPGGVTFLGNSDTGDTITPWLAPYPRMLFPVAVGIAAFAALETRSASASYREARSLRSGGLGTYEAVVQYNRAVDRGDAARRDATAAWVVAGVGAVATGVIGYLNYRRTGEFGPFRF